MDSAPVPPDSRRIGVREVARAAGVSTQTVSRVLNEHPNIRPETRQRVLQAISDLGYRVNNAARALGTRIAQPQDWAMSSVLFLPEIAVLWALSL
ncbi:LacI family DNA-binding transcriptional regulator, partial [Microbacterium arthrosphaerae]|uniref:LacI family DNA-binding transcriptional regulator n=1 Tax=Microbacterium arthrosphaerae TaxID=792652 RepID=UPI0035E494F2